MQAASTRFNGTLKKWSAERGFGFVMAEQGGQDLFLHVSAMPKDGWIPVIGEPLSFEVEIDSEGRKRAVRVRRPGVPVAATSSDGERARHLARQPAQSAGSGASFGSAGRQPRLVRLWPLRRAGSGVACAASKRDEPSAVNRAPDQTACVSVRWPKALLANELMQRGQAVPE